MKNEEDEEDEEEKAEEEVLTNKSYFGLPSAKEKEKAKVKVNTVGTLITALPRCHGATESGNSVEVINRMHHRL